MNQKFLNKLRSQLKETSRSGGWSTSQFTTWWSTHKTLHHREIQKCFDSSLLSQENPEKYTHWRALKQVIDPHTQAIGEMMRKYTDRIIGTTEDPSTYDQVTTEMISDLTSIIQIPSAADVFVKTYIQMARSHG